MRYRFLKPLIVLFCVALCLHSSSVPTLSRAVLFNTAVLPTLEKGDWVLRMGTVSDSQWIRYVSRGHYSHIGLVIQTTPKILILHATTDDDPQHLNQVIVSDLSTFFSPALAESGEVIRPLFLSKTQKEAIVKKALEDLGKPFVLTANNRPNLYCTTLLNQAITQVDPHFAPHWQTLNLPAIEGDYLFPNAFEHYPNTQVIFKFERTKK